MQEEKERQKEHLLSVFLNKIFEVLTLRSFVFAWDLLKPKTTIKIASTYQTWTLLKFLV